VSEDPHQLDVDQITKHIHQEVRRRLEGGRGLPVASFDPGSDRDLERDLGALRAHADVWDVALPAGRRGLGPLLTLAKKIARRLVTPSLARQVTYNLTNIRALDAVRQRNELVVARQARALADLATAQARGLERLQEQVEAADRVQADLQALLATQESALAEIGRAMNALREAQAVLRDDIVAAQDAGQREVAQRLAGLERKVRRAVTAPAAATSPPAAAGASPAAADDLDFDYFAFEQRFRGSEAQIKERQRPYLQHFRGAPGVVVDVACGRGEFVQLLQESGIQARGVDADVNMVFACREKGLDVTHMDAFVWLEAQPDASLGGVFSAQFIEHIEPQRVTALVYLCAAKLRPGAALILETINPKCLTVFAGSFYMDPSHVRPVHPETLRFVFESAGFADVGIHYSTPVDPSVHIPEVEALPAEFNQAIGRVNDLLFGCQDYAVIGRKRA